MKFDPEDTRLTAYVLGELQDEKDRAEVKMLLAHSEQARRYVEELLETASLLRENLAKEPTVGLTEKQREAIEATVAETPKKTFGGMWVGVAAAAVFLFTFTGIYFTMMSDPTPPPMVDLYLPDSGATPRPAPWTSGPEPAPSSPVTTVTTVTTTTPTTAAAARVETERRLAEPEVARRAESFDDAAENADVDFGVPGGVEGGVPGGMVGGIVGGLPDAPAPNYIRTYVEGVVSAPPPAALRPNRMAMPDIRTAERPFNTEAYDHVNDNEFLDVVQNPLSTFSIDVDTASYANVRRFINQNLRPPKDAVRIEELINYFTYDYPEPPDDLPFSVNVETASAPWRPEHRLMRIGLRGAALDNDARPAANLVFLLDVSGSMRPPDKLPLLKNAIRLLVNELDENDQVAMVVYAGASGMALAPTSGNDKPTILNALQRLEAGGSTNGGAGIQLAYDTAVANFIPGGVNRVVLATDGDFNIGVTNEGDLTRLIEERAASGVFLSVLGFGTGNYKDATLENLADRGNGNYAYIDSLAEARKVLVQEMGSTLVTIAKDVKIQIEFNPEKVQSYRLIGYENRMLAAEDFNDDKKDAGEIGAGHTVTALYEIVPAGAEFEARKVDPLKYQRASEATDVAGTDELLTVKLRYQEPDGNTSKLLEHPIRDDGKGYAQASGDFKFAASVATFGMILRDSPHKGNATIASVIELAEEGVGRDAYGYRTRFIELVRKARALLAR